MAESNISEIENKEIGVGDSSAQSLATKLEQARIHRHQGNAKFEAKIYKAAIGEYHRAILYLKVVYLTCFSLVHVKIVLCIVLYLLAYSINL